MSIFNDSSICLTCQKCHNSIFRWNNSSQTPPLSNNWLQARIMICPLASTANESMLGIIKNEDIKERACQMTWWEFRVRLSIALPLFHALLTKTSLQTLLVCCRHFASTCKTGGSSYMCLRVCSLITPASIPTERLQKGPSQWQVMRRCPQCCSLLISSRQPGKQRKQLCVNRRGRVFSTPLIPPCSLA